MALDAQPASGAKGSAVDDPFEPPSNNDEGTEIEETLSQILYCEIFQKNRKVLKSKCV